MKIKAIFFFFACMLNLLQHAPSSLASPIRDGYSDLTNYFKYEVSMERMNPKKDGYILFCSGGIISEKFILTVARCYLEAHKGKILSSVNLNEIKVLGGSNYYERNQIEKTVSNIFVPNTFETMANFKDDIAVLEVNSNWGLTENEERIAKIELDFHTPPENLDNKIGYLSGFGPYIYGSKRDGSWYPVVPYVNVRQYLGVKIFPKHKCPDYERQICAKSEIKGEFRTACEDDRGSPLEYDHKLIGVLTRAPICNTNAESMKFTRVKVFSNFIERAMSGHEYANMLILGEAQHRSTEHSSSSSSSHQSKHGSGNFFERFTHSTPRHSK